VRRRCSTGGAPRLRGRHLSALGSGHAENLDNYRGPTVLQVGTPTATFPSPPSRCAAELRREEGVDVEALTRVLRQGIGAQTTPGSSASCCASFPPRCTMGTLESLVVRSCATRRNCPSRAGRRSRGDRDLGLPGSARDSLSGAAQFFCLLRGDLLARRRYLSPT